MSLDWRFTGLHTNRGRFYQRVSSLRIGALNALARKPIDEVLALRTSAIWSISRGMPRPVMAVYRQASHNWQQRNAGQSWRYSLGVLLVPQMYMIVERFRSSGNRRKMPADGDC